MGWHYNAFCDWQPIEPHPTQPCKGGCRTEVDAPDGLCRACRNAGAVKRIAPQSERGTQQITKHIEGRAS